MGVIRREGDWRLEKRDDGIYEITYDGATEAKIVTSDYSPDIIDERYGVGVPVHEANSFSEAEKLFEEKAQSESPSPIGGLGGMDDSFGVSVSEDVESEYDSGIAGDDGLEELEELPPGGFALVMIGVGAFIIYSYGFAFDSLPTLAGVAMTSIGILIFGWAFMLYKTQGLGVAWNFLTTISEDNDKHSSDSESNNEPDRTPPASQSLKDELFFERANQKCEWCGERVDQPEVHHIEPRSEGGPNTPSNLIVLCPGCHAKADRGAISKTKLRSKIQRLMDSSAS